MDTYESSPSLRAAIERLAVHDHLCLIYETHAEQFAALIPFVRIGLERGEQCSYIADDNTAQTVLEALQGGGIDTGAARRSGALAILSKRDAYLKQGTFDPDWMIDFLAESTRGAKAAGFSALRVTGEMTWQLGSELGVERLIEYEAKLNRFLPAHDVLAICQYNRARFSPEIILDVIRTHPLVIAGGMVCRNFYYVPPDEFLKPEQPRHEADRLLANLREREQTDEARRESEARYRALAEAAPDMVFVIDRADCVQYVNTFAARQFGTTPEQMIGKARGDLFPPEIAGPQRQSLQRVFDSGQPQFVESPLRFDERKTWISTWLVPLRDESGAVTAVMGISRDITARKQAEEAVRRAEQRYRELFEDAPAMYATTTTIEGAPVIADCNGLFAQTLGYSRDELVGRPLADVYTPASRRLLVEGFPRALAGEFMAEERALLTRDGRSVPTLLRSKPERDAAGRVSGTRAMFVDISERKQAEEALAHERDLLYALMDNIPDQVYFKDTASRFTRINRAQARFLGVADPEQAVGRTDADFQPPEQSRAFYSEEQRIVETGQPIVDRIEFNPTAAGQPRWLSATKVAIRDRDGQVTGTVGISRDITERKRAEEALRDSERLLTEAQIIAGLGSYVLAFPTGVWTSSAVLDALFGIDQTYERSVAGWAALIHPDDRQPMLDYFANEVIGRRARFDKEYRIIRHNDKAECWVHGLGQLTVDDQGSVVSMSGTIQDITERKRAENALHESEERYHNLFDAAPVGIAVHADGKIVFTNPSGARLLGADSVDRLIGRSVQDIIHPAQLQETLQRMRRMMAGEAGLYPVEEVFLRLDGTPIDVEVMATPLSYQGKPAVQVIVSDISERMRGQEQLRRRLAELEALHTVSAALRSAQTIDEALPILLDETLAALETDAGAISLYQPASDDLHAAIARGWFEPLGITALKPGEGIGGTVFASGQAHRTAEFRSDPLTREATRERVPAGWGGVCLPIRTGATSVGVLFVSKPATHPLTPEQVKLLESLAEMAGAALHRMRLHEATMRQLSQLQALHDIDRAISASTDLRITLDVLVEHVTAQLGVDAAAVLLLNPYTHILEYASGRGLRTRQAQTARVRVGEGFAGRAVQERGMVHATDAAAASPHFALLWQQEGLAEYYGVPLIAKGQVKGVLEVFHRTPLTADAHWLDLLETLAGQAAIAIDSAQLFEGLQRSNLNLSLAYDATIEGWSRALDLRDKETEGHTQRVTALTLRLARAMGLSDGELVHVRRGALLHDIGKMGVPDSILHKPGPLSASEWELMRKHPVYAYEMLAPIAYLQPALDIPYCHHEKWDGTGYPRGLKGEQIPLTARIFAVVDVWDALNSDRTYRKAWSEAEALVYIRAEAGRHFDPRVVGAFLAEQGHG
ncbi:MAG: PAS domain S-box protein [Chloroflexi bacterium]|nr:PAS domain S-box protein [Chloroflexota bacterium]